MFIQGPYLMVWAVSLLTTKLIPRSLTGSSNKQSIQSLLWFGTVLTARINTVLYPSVVHNEPLCLNTFRGEPASSKFDRNFSATLNSSVDFSNRAVQTSTSYHQSFILIKSRSLGFGSRRKDECPIQTRFHYGFKNILLTKPFLLNRWRILQQARCQLFKAFNCL